MSQDQLHQLLTALMNDASLQNKFKQTSNPEEAAALSQAEGYDVTKIDLLRHLGHTLLRLDDAELEGIAIDNNGFHLGSALCAPTMLSCFE